MLNVSVDCSFVSWSKISFLTSLISLSYDRLALDLQTHITDPALLLSQIFNIKFSEKNVIKIFKTKKYLIILTVTLGSNE